MTTINDFEVLVLATMSAGKSTFINALLGQELLPAANQATTARIFRIENHDNHDFEMRYVSDNEKTDWVTATKENLKSFNDSSEPGQIELRGCIAVARTLQASLVLYDTPGPNNSQDINHAKTTLKLLKDSEHGLILYVLNATQVGVNDDAVLLRELKKMLDRPENSHKQVFFILNKADKLNKSRDGSLHEIVGNSAAYLKSFGFVNPVIIPICAAAALLAREAIAKGGITDHQLDELDYFERRFKKEPDFFWEASGFRDDFKKLALIKHQENVEGNSLLENETSFSYDELQRVIYSSGLPMIDFLLEKLIKKQEIKN